MWYVYIVECRDKTLYTGIAKDVSRRVKRHNAGGGSNYTRMRLPVKLVYQETHSTQVSALKREAQIKRWSRHKKLARIKGNLQELSKLSVSRD